MRCNLCPRSCRCDRVSVFGACGAGTVPRVAKSMLHHWEEPFVSGTRGSGAVFFSGCNLGCIFCQNEALQSGTLGIPHDPDALSELYLSLEADGAHNINLVTPTPHIPVIRESLRLAKRNGLKIPVLYNTGSYERVSALSALEGLVDVYLPDLKYVSPILSERFSGAADYFAFAAPALEEMYRQTGELVLDTDGIAVQGVAVRHLILPGCVDDSRRVLDYLAERFPLTLHLSLMRQYTPTPRVTEPPLNRKLTDREYERTILYALDKGFHNILIQEKSSATLAYTPDFASQQQK